MKTSPKGIQLIKHYEGLRLEAYKDSVGVVTIGYGTTMYPGGKQVKMGDRCTEEEAEEFLKNDLSYLEPKISRHFKEVNQDQFDALVSFSYNLGFGALLSSTLRRKILQNINDPSIGLEWMKWVYAGKIKLEGLKRRRRSEYILYSTGNLVFNDSKNII